MGRTKRTQNLGGLNLSQRMQLTTMMVKSWKFTCAGSDSRIQVQQSFRIVGVDEKVVAENPKLGSGLALQVQLMKLPNFGLDITC